MDNFVIVLDTFLDDAFGRLAGKNYLSHCIVHQTKRHDAHKDSQHTVAASSTSRKLKLQARKKTSPPSATALYRESA
jgi:hypothetical protein